MSDHDQPLALCVDLDGTLVATDTLYESLLNVAKRKPWLLAAVPAKLSAGKAPLKAWLAQHGPIEAEALPYREPVLQLIREAKSQGRRVVLASAADQSITDAVAEHLGVFDDVLGSDGSNNLKGQAKADALQTLLGSNRCTYVGDSAADLPLFQWAREALLVAPVPSVRDTALRDKPEARVLVERKAVLLPAFKALRLHQWSKNLLVAVPMLTGHVWGLGSIMLALLAMLSFGLIASSIYLLNDLMDLSSDRRHPTKRRRPLAAGALPIPHGLALSCVCLTLGLLVAWLGVGEPFLGIMVIYLVLTTAYSMAIKAKPVLDVITLASLYTLRLLAGGLAVNVEVSFWLLAFSMFLFVSLAFAKRYTELLGAAERDQETLLGRGYQSTDLSVLGVFGPISGYMSVLVFALYLRSSEVYALYEHPLVLWLACPVLLYWISHFWLMTSRGRMDEDPVVYALRDRRTYACVLLIVLLGLRAGPL